MKTFGRRPFLLFAGGAAAGLAAGASPLALALSPQARLHTRRFFALGTRVTVLVRHPDGAAARQGLRDATRAVFEVHETATVFEPSPLTRLNAVGHGAATPVPALLLELLGHAHRLTLETEGLFDPAVGRVTALHRTAGTHRFSAESAGLRATGRPAFELDLSAGRVRLQEAHVSLDLNAVAKGYAVDRAAAALRAQGLTDFLVNAGGDVYAAGRADDSAPGWEVRIADPGLPSRSIGRLVLTDEAVATSGNYQRPRLDDGTRRVHLVDPRDAAASQGLLCATITAPTCADADAFATAAFVAGVEQAKDLLGRRHDLRGRHVDRARAVHVI